MRGVLACLLGIVVVPAQLIVGDAHASIGNGSFETPVLADDEPWRTIPEGGTIGPWNVTAGDVDIVFKAATAQDGRQSIDMAGSRAGEICQVFATTTGAAYDVSFWMSHNAVVVGFASLAAEITGVTRLSFTHDRPSTNDAPLWEQHIFSFTATGGSSELCFESTVPPVGEVISGAALLDNVTVIQQPAEPGAFANGSFETPVIHGLYRTIGTTGERIGSWRVTEGDVDIQFGWATAQDARQSVDMSGLVGGEICQTFATTTGATYDVSFRLSHNEVASDSASLAAEITGVIRLPFTHGKDSTTIDPQWEPHVFSFTATGDSSELCFESTQPPVRFGPDGGAMLDNVTVQRRGDPDVPPPPPPPPPPAPPVLGGAAVAAGQDPGPPTVGETFNAGPVSGVVTFRCGNGRRRPLEETEQLPIGCRIDARRGSVRVTSAAGDGSTQSGVFSGGAFIVNQKAGTKPVTELRLVGPLENCPRRRAASIAGGPGASDKPGRRLWGKGKGAFRTRGRRSAATVTGTRWLVEDRCDGSTLTKVTSGTVSVRDFVRGRTITLRRGESYVARPGSRQGR